MTAAGGRPGLVEPDLIQVISNPVDPDDAPWLARAADLAETLRADVVERDLARVDPHAEFELIRASGLLGLTLPAELGGGGRPWRTGAAVTRLLARTDASIAQVLGYHYTWLRVIDSLDTATARTALERSAREGWLWASPGSSRAGYPVLSADESGRRTLTGESAFATGGPLADRLFTQALDSETGRLTVVVLDPSIDEVVFTEGWDALGQRLSASSGISIRQAPVADEEVLAVLTSLDPEPLPWHTIGVLNFQLMFSTLHVGITEGALLEAAEYTREHTRPALHARVEAGRDDPYILSDFGKYLARTQAVAALVERSTRALDWLYSRGEAITAIERTEVAEIIASAKVVSTETGLEVTSRLFELTGARSTATKFGLGRFWRDLRTLSLHDPLAYKYEELGRFFVNGEAPTPSGYR